MLWAMLHVLLDDATWAEHVMAIRACSHYPVVGNALSLRQKLPAVYRLHH